MKFYATGYKRDSKTGDVVNVIVPLSETMRVSAVNQAKRIAKRDKWTLQDVRPANNKN